VIPSFFISLFFPISKEGNFPFFLTKIETPKARKETATITPVIRNNLINMLMPLLNVSKIRIFREFSLFHTQLTQPLTLLNFLSPLKKQKKL